MLPVRMHDKIVHPKAARYSLSIRIPHYWCISATEDSEVLE